MPLGELGAFTRGVDFRKKTLLRRVLAVFIMAKYIPIMAYAPRKRNRLFHKSLR